MMNTTRRGFLMMGALGAVGLGVRPNSALGAVSIRPAKTGEPKRVLVSIFLRGGADGLSLVVPYADDNYYRVRPTIAIASPNDHRASARDRSIALDDYFALNPNLAPMVGLYEKKQLAFVHACGSGDQTRSHFEAMATMERGLYQNNGPASGWLARHLQTSPRQNTSPLRAVALSSVMPSSLVGAPSATAVNSLTDLRLSLVPGVSASNMHALIGDLYEGSTSAGLAQAGTEAVDVLRALAGLSPSSYKPENGAAYGKDDLGSGLSQVAMLMKSRVGLEVACLDHQGYDTHVVQGASTGYLGQRLHSLSQSVAAFVADIGATRWASTTIVVVSEFGRRVEENSGAGTDHGRAGVMMVMGGTGVAGGKVHGTWPTLAPGSLEGPGDLRVTTDYRSVLSEVIDSHMGNPNIEDVFPGLARKPVGVAYA